MGNFTTSLLFFACYHMFLNSLTLPLATTNNLERK